MTSSAKQMNMQKTLHIKNRIAQDINCHNKGKGKKDVFLKFINAECVAYNFRLITFMT